MKEMANTKRIKWVDIAKAIAIFAMIQGHTTPYGSPARNFIYSFHMPLFFILTGYTAKEISSFADFKVQLKKDFFHIFLPCVLVHILEGVLSVLIYHENWLTMLQEGWQQFFWGSAIDVYEYRCLGMLWFLIALFWAKTLYNLVQLIFPSKYNGAVYLFFAIWAKALADSQIYLPQSLDVVLMIVLFLYVGKCYRQQQVFFEKYQLPIVLIAFCIWMLCLEQGIYIELGGRQYINFVKGTLGAVSGCLCVFTLAHAMESNKWVANILGYFGRHTMIILCVSSLDWMVLPLWGKSITFAYVARPVIVLLVSVMVIGIKTFLSRSFVDNRVH